VAWVRLDDKRATNRKLREVGFAARGLDEAAICWCAHEESDGKLTDADLAMIAALHGCKRVQPLVDALVGVGRWKRRKEGDGYMVKDYLDYNPSHADLESQRRRDRDRKRKQNGSDTDSHGNPDGSDTDSQDPDRPTDRPTPSLRKRRIPDDWRPSETDLAWLAKQASSEQVDVSFQTAQFKDHHQGKGNVFVDISRAWKTWMRNALTNFGRTTPTQGKSPGVVNLAANTGPPS
jgi:hypothetical protein